jgi:hypothetical protein
MENLRRVVRHGDPLTNIVLIDHVAPALPCEGESRLLKYSDDLPGSEAGKPRHQTVTSTVERLTERC